MSFKIKKMVLHNRAPFEHIELSFNDKKMITILSAVNGGGKTTILSHIADAWYEIARLSFSNEFEGKENKYYRVSSDIFSIDNSKPSFVSIQFAYNDKIIEYLDLRGRGIDSEEKYNELLSDTYAIKYNEIKSSLEQANNVKHLSEQDTKTLAQIFQNNIVTFFPAYRHEQPGYLNDPYKIKLDYGLTSKFSGYLQNPIEVITDLPHLANWLMDVILDLTILQENKLVQILFQNIRTVFSAVLSIRSGKILSLSIGQRNRGATRIQVGERDANGEWIKTVYPSIFNMSSGENTLICLFGELVRQFDRIRPNSPAQLATGLVLIDEIDKHLHIRMQKDVLPTLMELFPNVQFIISSHSPFVAMGLEGNAATNTRTKIIDLDSQGMVTDLSITRVFTEGYEAMVEKNKQYKEIYYAIKKKFDSAKLQIFSEGNNVEHIKRAIELINDSILDKIDFNFSDKTGWQQLKTAYEVISTSNLQAKYLFVFDCDCGDSANQLVENDKFFRFVFSKNDCNEKVKKGIENLYPSEMFIDKYYPSNEQSDGYGAKKIIQEFDKRAFLDTVKTDTNVDHFTNFRPLIDKIKEILSK
ncbi:MAG: AAA family ATPase [Campylobacteraceae bacterium]|jgi:predicted ATPase|nr:AAA family ATPase [Campylobacteraceae bacterium]